MPATAENPSTDSARLLKELEEKESELTAMKNEITRLREAVGRQNEAIELFKVQQQVYNSDISPDSNLKRTETVLREEWLMRDKADEDINESLGGAMVIASVIAVLLFCLETLLPEKPSEAKDVKVVTARRFALKGIAHNEKLREVVNSFYRELNKSGGKQVCEPNLERISLESVGWESGHGVQKKPVPLATESIDPKGLPCMSEISKSMGAVELKEKGYRKQGRE
ncbi:unnamed protein product [Cercospora beticola]|nr:unnamed protein product [Cercospora beticola]